MYHQNYPPYMSQGNPGTEATNNQPYKESSNQPGYHPYPTAQNDYAPQPVYMQQQNYPPGYPADNQTTAPLPNQQNSNTNDDTDFMKSFDFNTESIRRGFIRKVYGLLTLQLIVTFGGILLFCLHDGVKTYAIKNIWLLVVAVVVYFVAIISLSCCEGVRRTHPTNLIFMAFFTLGTTVLLGYVGAVYAPDTVMIAMGLTAIMTVGLTIFAIQTKWDFTKLGGALFIAILLFIVAGIVASIIRSHYLDLVISCIGVLLFSIYLIHDTQQIIGGNHKYQMSPEEYVLGAIALYLDIIEIFLYLLRIVAAAKN